MKFSLVIPCYNEAANLPLLLARCAEVANAQIEIILVDNGSTDSTGKVLAELLPNYPYCKNVRVEKNQGYGFGILSGLSAAQGDIVGWTHADMQTDPKDILVGLTFFEQHGRSIFVKGERYGRPMMDVLFTIFMSFFETLLFRRKFWDINAQPVMFSRAFMEKWEKPPHDFSLDLYAYYQAHRQNLEIYRFPVNFGQRAHGVSHWNVNWRAKWKFIKRTMEFSFQLKKSVRK